MLAGGFVAGHADESLSCDSVTIIPQDLNAQESTPVSNACVTPYIVPAADGRDRGGNRSCADVGKAYFGNPLYYQCRSDKVDYPFGLPQDFGPTSGLPDDCANTITVDVYDDTFVTWTSTHPVGAAIIKGGPAANTYVYEPQLNHDSGLASPPVSGGLAGLSNIGGFCWNPEETPFDECFADETAWAANGNTPGELRYNRRGNWATYVEYKGVAKTVTLFAGQTINVGTAEFSAPDNGEVVITFTLTGDWVFGVNYELDDEGNLKLDDEGNPIRDNNIKVQDYLSAPGGNPAPGLFAWKAIGSGTSASITVPLNKFYGVHLDVAEPVECP
jgi:hypothetical protein